MFVNWYEIYMAMKARERALLSEAEARRRRPPRRHSPAGAAPPIRTPLRPCPSLPPGCTISADPAAAGFRNP
jgi:hypothetical protein